VVEAYNIYVQPVPAIEDTLKDIAPLVSSQQRVLAMVWSFDASNNGVVGAAPPPAPGGAKPLPLEVKLDIDFAGAGATVDLVDASAALLQNELKKGLPQYEVSADPYPWHKEDGQNETVSLDVNAVQNAALKNTVAVFKLRGLKPVLLPAVTSDGAAIAATPGQVAP
jgi:hypothetical protein